MDEFDATSAISLEEELALGKLRDRLFGARERRFKVSRYVLVDRLGSGGSAVVYRAFDPELDRRVAVKLLAPTPIEGENTQSARDRVAEEARLIAQLSHPNIVPVYDVGDYDLATTALPGSGASQVDDPRRADPTSMRGVFIVMEYVEGATLSDWIADEKPDQHARLEAYLQAGRGLEAAHEKGLVHRDFKPQNTIRGGEGRVRVLDFGIARWLEEGAAGCSEESGELPRGTNSGSVLTETISGTPRYMSPEQHSGGRINARSDQFSYAVALYEALFDRQPFDGENMRRLAEAKREGQADVVSGGGELSPRLRQALARALAPDPERRFSAMAPFLAELERELDRPRRRRLAAGGVAFAVAVGALGLAYGRRAQDPCARAKIEAQLDGAWDEDVRERVRQRFASLELPYADSSHVAVAASLDRYAGRWVERRRELCEVASKKPDARAVVDAEVFCLEQRRAELSALGRELERADSEAVQRSVVAAQRVDELESCRQVSVSRGPSIPTGARRAEAGELEELMTQSSHAFILRGDAKASRELVDRAYEGALRLDLLVIASRAQRWRCELDREAGQFERARERCHAALVLARQANDSSAAVEALISLVGLAANWQGDHRGAREFLALAEVEADRQGATAQVRAELAAKKGLFLQNLGEGEKATASYRDALRHYDEAFGGPSVEHAIVHNNLGLSHYMRGDYAAALHELRSAMEIRQSMQGESHPSVGEVRNNIGAVVLDSGDAEGALVEFRAALEIAKVVQEETHPQVSGAMINIGNALMTLGRFDEARPFLEQSLEFYTRSHGDKHSRTAMALTNFGGAYDATGDHEKAYELHDRAVKIREEVLPEGHLDHAWAWVNRGGSAYHMGRNQEARRDLEAARRRFIEVQGGDTPLQIPALLYLSRLDIEEGDSVRGRRGLERARELLRQHPDPANAARVDLSLAQLGHANEPVKALERVREIRRRYPPGGYRRDNAELIDAWISEHEAIRAATGPLDGN
jgi:tetratricopeptide (TPR) repeat protein